MIRWLNRTNPDGAYNSKGQQGSSTILTGSNEEYKVNNIYDIAGNVSEFVFEEAYGAEQEYVCRGGDHRTIPLSASLRSHTTDIKGDRIGSRQVLLLDVPRPALQLIM